MSAAIVVFLAVKGGLAAFAVDAGEPNAYVLFFTCLIGAVFSEDVWAWARKRFEENFLNANRAPGSNALPPASGPQDRAPPPAA